MCVCVRRAVSDRRRISAYNLHDSKLLAATAAAQYSHLFRLTNVGVFKELLASVSRTFDVEL